MEATGQVRLTRARSQAEALEKQLPDMEAARDKVLAKIGNIVDDEVKPTS